MHFIGPDQHHGFEERLATDIYPADFSWTPDWTQGPAHRPTGVSMRPVLEAGPCLRSMQIDYDDEVEYKAVQKLYDLARAPEQQPFFMTVSFTHPHPPFAAPQRFWDLYDADDIDAPHIPEISYAQLDEHSKWLHIAHAQNEYTVGPEQVKRARHAYYGMVSYVDEKIGQVLRVLRETGMDQDTVVVLCADHGEMLGERGMWFKQCFFEWSIRVPLMVSYPPQFEPGRCAAHVSLVDLLPTFMDFARPSEEFLPVDPLHGQSLVPLMRGEDDGSDRVVVSEYSSEGVCAASRVVRTGPWKYIYTYRLPPILFNLADDPDELINLSGTSAVAHIEQRLHARLVQDWEPASIHATILASQRRRLFLYQVNCKSKLYSNWAFQPFVDESKRFIRGSGSAGPTTVKGRARFPFVAPVAPDRVLGRVASES
jgi:choline-sulfatase